MLNSQASFRLPKLLVLSAALLAAGLQAQVVTQSLADRAAIYAKAPAISDVRPSPSGNRVAMLVNSGKGEKSSLAILNLPVKSPPKIIASFDNANISNVFWVSEDRLVFSAQSALEDDRLVGGTFAVDHDGTNSLQLIAQSENTSQQGSRLVSKTLNYTWAVVGPLRGGQGPQVLVRQGVSTSMGDWEAGKTARLNTMTGELTLILVNAPENSVDFIFDAQGEPRLSRTASKGRDKIYLRTAGTNQWQVISDLPSLSSEGMDPLYLEDDENLVVSTRNGKNTAGLYLFNLKTLKLDPEPLVHAPRYDIGQIKSNSATRKVIGAELVAEHGQSVWFEPSLAALQKGLDATLPKGRHNHIICGNCVNNNFFVIHSASDQHPGEYFIFDKQNNKLLPLGSRRPWIDPTQQAKQTFHWTKARDGLDLPIVITHPYGKDLKQKLPTVLLVHGGPWVRGARVQWNPESQYLASLGYRVIEPDFRGSLGYGESHFRASFKQWGLTMQDDLIDALNFAVDQGMSDPSRVCIYGGSYGGYAALMGPIAHAGQFKCAASVVGVTDIMLMFNSVNSDMSRDSKQYTIPELLGDPVADKDKLAKVSPLARVSEIKVPILLAQGLQDRRVPREHADRFESAAKASGVSVKRLNYPTEGHGFKYEQNRADFWKHLGEFLNQNLTP
jgi:dipeptidyl aminopeptidase/acylaminoacyl peptidase